MSGLHLGHPACNVRRCAPCAPFARSSTIAWACVTTAGMQCYAQLRLDAPLSLSQGSRKEGTERILRDAGDQQETHGAP